jgi:hypothetical protein
MLNSKIVPLPTLYIYPIICRILIPHNSPNKNDIPTWIIAIATTIIAAIEIMKFILRQK